MPRDLLRQRYVGDVLGEIKRVALDQLERGGPTGVSINAIGRELGVSGPALYRYVGSWEQLITTLIVDAYRDLGAALTEAVSRRRTPRTRVTACVDAYRAWARAEPHRYRLLFQAPRPGYAFNDPELVEASQTAMNVLIEAVGSEAVPRPRRDDLGIGSWLAARGLSEDLSGAGELAVGLWVRLHGLVSLEIEGCFEALGLQVDALYERELTLP